MRVLLPPQNHHQKPGAASIHSKPLKNQFFHIPWSQTPQNIKFMMPFLPYKPNIYGIPNCWGRFTSHFSGTGRLLPPPAPPVPLSILAVSTARSKTRAAPPRRGAPCGGAGGIPSMPGPRLWHRSLWCGGNLCWSWWMGQRWGEFHGWFGVFFSISHCGLERNKSWKLNYCR